MKDIIYILLMILFFACSPISETETVIQINNNSNELQAPILIPKQIIDTINLFKSDCITDAKSIYIDKFKYSEKIKLANGRDTNYKSSYISEYYYSNDDSIYSDGLQVLINFKSSVEYKIPWENKSNHYFPVYLINETNSTKMFNGKDNRVFAIQEALDSNGMWRPIEKKPFDFCGNGHFGVKIYPQELILFLMPKYIGNYETSLRVRLKIGDNIYVSPPYTGHINYSQFYFKKEDSHDSYLESPINTVEYLFYGSIPLELDLTFQMLNN